MLEALLKLTEGLGLHWPDPGNASLMIPSFARPLWLLVIPPLWIVAWWIARRSLAYSGGLRHWMHLGIRCVVLAMLAVVLAEPHVRWRADDVAVLAVVDVSDSVPAPQRQLADDFLTASLSRRLPQDRFGLITIAKEALVQSLPTAALPTTDIGLMGRGDASDLRAGVDLARALVPSDTAGRILLISDGNETTGSLAAAADAFASFGIPIDVASVDYDRSMMISVCDIIVPAWAREGDVVNVRVMMQAGRADSGRLTLLLNDNPIDLEPEEPSLSTRVELVPGLQAFTVPVKIPAGSVQKFEAIFEPDDRSASVPGLLRAEGVTFTSSPGNVLVLAEDADAAGPLVAALTRGGLRVETRPALDAPRSLAEWAGYDAVVLFDQPASNFSQAQQQDMVNYVHDTGGGLLAIGGPDSFGAGGWIGSPVADILPVQLDPPHKRQMPLGALALIIDHSGSMSSAVSGTGMNQQQIANEAAILAVRALSRMDQLTVVSFDSTPTLVVPLTHVGDPDAIVRRIRTIGPGGGTNLFPALDAAGSQLGTSPAGIRHMIVLTDGQTQGDPAEGLAIAARLKSRGITISTVAIGDGSNDPLLSGIARTAGGRFYTVGSQDSRAILPQIFIKEAKTVRRSLIWEGEPFAPKVGVAGDAMRQIAGPLPRISGYVVTADRGGLSTVALRGPENDPILAQWQHGLGRVTAYTSDAAARWNTAWVSWDAFGTFWEQQLKWVMRPGDDIRARVSIDTDQERAKVLLELFDGAGERVSFAGIRARLTPPDGSADDGTASRDVEFRQVGPGRYEASVDATSIGTHLLSIRYETGGGGQDQPRAGGGGGSGENGGGGSARAAIIRRSDVEFREPTPATTTLWEVARKTNGRMYRLDPAGANLWVRDHLAMPEISRSAWLVVAMTAVGLFLVDVAARRVSVSVESITARVNAMLRRAPEATAPSFATLAAAKARAAASTGSPPAVRATPSQSRETRESREFSPTSVPARTPANPLGPTSRTGSTAATPESSPQSPPGPQTDGGDEYLSRLRATKTRSTQKRSGSPDEERGS